MACEYLIKEGHKIIETNFYCKMGEIDIITMKNNCIHFIEVKFRASTEFGYSNETVSKHKWNKIYKTSQYYLKVNNMSFDTCCSFDVVAIQGTNIEYIENCYGVM